MTIQEKVRSYMLTHPGTTAAKVAEVFGVEPAYAQSLLQRSKVRRIRKMIKGVRTEHTVPYTQEEQVEFLKSFGKEVPEEKPKKSDEPTSVDQDKEESANDYWQRQYNALNRKYSKVIEDSCIEDRLVDLAHSVIKTPYTPLPSVHIDTDGKRNGHTPQSAVLLLSDAHIGKVVDPNQTLGFGRYDFDTFLNRLKHLEERIVSILTEHSTSKLNQLTIALMGDMVDGSLTHAAEAGQQNTVFTQCYNGAHAIAQFLRCIAPYVPKIDVQTVVGNHGRWGNQHKMPTKNRNSNLDMFFYAIVDALVKDVKNIKFNLNTQPFQTVKVENSVLWIGHGDHLRGGDKALGVPAHSIGRQLSTVAQMHSREGRPVPNIYCVGDKHKSMELPHCNGDFIINSSFVGYDEYAHTQNFPDSGPAQKLFFVHPKYGRTATYNIYLQHAREFTTRPYDIPGGFDIQ